jgi:hypothetical protein
LTLEVEVDSEEVVLQVSGAGLPPAALSATLTVDIRATQLVFLDTIKTQAYQGEELLSGSLRVAAVHQDGNVDAEFSGPITLSAVAVGTDAALDALTVTPAPEVNPIQGEVTFTAAQYQDVGAIHLFATSPGLESARSDTLHITGTLTLQAPNAQSADQLTFQRGAQPEQLALLAFALEPAGETLALQSLDIAVELGGGLQPEDLVQVHW